MTRWVVLAVLVTACTVPPASGPTATTADVPPPGDEATLIRVDDGDSFLALVAGQERRIRMIGINAPEQGECLADVARSRLAELLSGGPFTLVNDIEPVDHFDRQLRYVYLGSELVNATMAAEGLVLARAFEPNTSRQDTLEAAEQTARDGGLGIWDPGACGSETAALAITHIEADPPGPDLEGEYLEIANADSEVDLTGWSIRDESSQNRFEFPPGTRLGAGDRLRVYSGCGSNTVDVLHWCSSSPIWDNAGDTAFLVTPTGSNHVTLGYGP